MINKTVAGWKWKDVPFTRVTRVCKFRAQAPLMRCVPTTISVALPEPETRPPARPPAALS